ncbi:MAG: mannosyl-3-phosphoglycerate phosphatase [Nitrososphaera sp.]|nr:mannosyl-3-phosphoglycerate phosphatase [Nitrososphaera sp.]
MRPKVVFSDIDGTLIDTFTREYGKSKEIVKKLKEYSIPVVLCSSKTRDEQDVIRKDLELEEPFIVENGGAIVIPEGYFGDEHITRADGYTVIELGKPSVEIQKALQEVRKAGISFKGVSDVSVEKLAEIVGMTHDEAARMSKRQYGETILEIDESQKSRFEEILREKGFRIIHGGRYFDVTSGNDKGKAVKILSDLYRKKLGDDTIFIGVGDSPNDESMLRSVDIPILVQMHDGSWAQMDISKVVQVRGIGPAGWENAFIKTVEADAAEI